MNSENFAKQRNSIYFVGSARGVRRFYLTNKLMEKLPMAKVIVTGVLINNIIKKLGFTDMDNISLLNYHRLVEPVVFEIIASHLEHNDVILDTHYHYLIPGLSAKELIKFRNKVEKIYLFLIEDEAINISSQNKEEWFANIDNVRNDLLLNKYFFGFYKSLFQEFSDVKAIAFNNENYRDMDNIEVN